MNGNLALAKMAAVGAVAIALCVPAAAADLGAGPVYTKALPPPPML
jgi:hypothetical protein